ncbi:hypothetical protein ACFL43_00425 [Thermodesulfobacteriota bacterium]
MKQAILIIGLWLLLTGCVVTESYPLGIDVTVQGNPESFYTEYETGNNAINVTIKQEASKLIIYKWPDISDWMQPYFTLRCYDLDTYDYAFDVNLTLLEHVNGEYIEKRLDKNTVLRYPWFYGYTKFNPRKEKYNILGNKSYAEFECKVRSDLKFQYQEYIDGILITNKTDKCDYFWLDWDRIDLECSISDCDYYFHYVYHPDKLKDFLEWPHEYITDNCFYDQTRYD